MIFTQRDVEARLEHEERDHILRAQRVGAGELFTAIETLIAEAYVLGYGDCKEETND